MKFEYVHLSLNIGNLFYFDSGECRSDPISIDQQA